MTSICNLGCLFGFIMSFIVFVRVFHADWLIAKGFNPWFNQASFQAYLDANLVTWFLVREISLGNCLHGTLIFSNILQFLLVFPLSLPREVGKLSFASALAVIGTIYVSLVITLIFWFDRTQVPDPIANFKKAQLFTVFMNYYQRVI